MNNTPGSTYGWLYYQTRLHDAEFFFSGMTGRQRCHYVHYAQQLYTDKLLK
jgi:hypothetical protein